MGALIVDDRRRILIVERAGEPLQGWWSIPGGVVETGETLTAAVRREVREETGLEIEIVTLIEVFERIMRDDSGRAEYHYVLLDYLCRPVGGVLAPSSDASDARWVTEEELPSYRITEGTPGVIAKAFAYLRENE